MQRESAQSKENCDSPRLPNSGRKGVDNFQPLDVQAERKQKFLDTLYRTYWKSLCLWLRRRYGKGPPEPEDIAQAAFAKIAALDDVDRIQNPRAFLYATAVNTALSGIDWISRTRQFIDKELVDHGETVEEITPERVYLDKERFQIVNVAMDRLSAKQREILMRSRIQGQTYDQIGLDTGWSNAEISRQLNKALEILHNALENEENTLQSKERN